MTHIGAHIGAKGREEVGVNFLDLSSLNTSVSGNLAAWVPALLRAIPNLIEVNNYSDG
jgi:hypothetical protein